MLIILVRGDNMDEIEFYSIKSDTHPKIPLYTMSVSAGYPMPVDEEVERVIDLNEYLVDHPAATFFAKIRGYSMRDVGINDGDILIVDSSVVPTNGRLVIAKLGDKMTVKYYKIANGEIYLESQDKKFLPLEIEGLLEFKILGTVTKIIRSI